MRELTSDNEDSLVPEELSLRGPVPRLGLRAEIMSRIA